jgi:hypothetical protein
VSGEWVGGCDEGRGEWVKKVAVKGSVQATNTAQCSCKQEQRRGKVECMSGGMVDIYYLLALSRRPRPGWPLEERVGRREVEVGATSSCLGVRSRYFARPGHGALRRGFYLLATSTLSNDSSSHLPCRSTTLVLVSRLRTAPPPPLSCWWAVATSQPSSAAAFALLPSLYPPRGAVLLSMNPPPHPSQSRRRCPMLPQSASRLAYRLPYPLR